MPTTTIRPNPEFITAATLKALASGVFEPSRLFRAMELALDPRSVILPDGSIDVPTSDGFVIFTVDEKRRVDICECRDYPGPNAQGWCKHRIAAALMVRALDAQNAATAAQNAQPAQTPTPEPERPTVPVLVTPAAQSSTEPHTPARKRTPSPEWSGAGDYTLWL